MASEHGHGGATKWKALMARSEPYNPLALLHPQSMADDVMQSSDQMKHMGASRACSCYTKIKVSTQVPMVASQ